MKSIRTKLMVYFSGLILIVCAIFTFASINALTNAVVNEAKKSLESRPKTQLKLSAAAMNRIIFILKGSLPG